MTASEIRKRRVEVLEKIRCIESNDIGRFVVRGQYGRGTVRGKQISAYREEKDVDSKSMTETFVAFKLFIDNPRWQGVPFYLRCGKRMAESVSRIDILLKNRQTKLFRQSGSNIITIRVQPKEGISMQFFTKIPGLAYEIKPVNMDFSYSNTFRREIADSYEKILIDSVMADQTLFATARGFEATWEFITSITRVWEKESIP